MGWKDFLSILLCIALIHSAIAYPRAGDSDEDDDTQQQQQQNIDSDSLEELTQKIHAKGRRPQKLQVTELEPEPEPYDPCLDARKIGPCKGRIPRFFFNQATGSCERFSWGGCSKTGNNFKELTECETSCSKHLTKAKLDVEQDQTSVVATCEKPPTVQGAPECEAYIPRWTFNATEQQCVRFIWGGCAKTENNFATESSCKATCGEYSNLKSGATTPRPSGGRGLEQQQNSNIQEPQVPLSREVCELPSESGRCLAFFERYYFNKINNRCELFTYGGCGGNENRFDTAEDCVRACGGDSPVSDVQCADVECPWALYDHYYSLGCSPIYDGDSCCPTRYECPDTQQELQNNTIPESRSLTLENETSTVGPDPTLPQQCRYRGKYYNVGEMVDAASDTGSCRAGCICVSSEPEAPRIVCAQIECAEHFRGKPPGKENCVPLYKKDSCCAHDYHCPEGGLTIVDPKDKDKVLPLAKCMVDGEGFYEGQRVYPNKSPCAKCLCQRDPNNVTSPEGQLYCEKIDCGIEIYYSHYLARGCAPVYYEKDDGTTSCCPISWQCPDDQQEEEGDEDIIPPPPATTPSGPGGPQPPRPPSTDEPTTSTPLPPVTEKPNSPLRRSHEACTMPKAEGSCKGHRPRFWYNAETEKCESFVYTGCRGNFNNFASEEDCRDLCEPGLATTTPASSNPPAKGGKTGGLLGRSLTAPVPPRETKAISLTEVDSCTLPKRVGRCKGYFPRFHYSPEDNECKLFIFGGCRPNANNFYTKDSCEATCLNKIPVENLRTNLPAGFAEPEQRLSNNIEEGGGDATRVNFGEEERTFELRTPRPPTPPASASAEEENPCTLPPRTGRCKAFVRRFYYDGDKKMCKSFTYGGCTGNANNFQTLEDCDARCGTGRTLETNTRRGGQGWRIADNNGGNVNPTPSQTGIGARVAPSPTARCKLPKQAGSCHASVRSYYYDVESKSCKLFFYSGCFGNANRFSGREDCENLCKKPLESEGSSSTNGAINQPSRPQVHDLSQPTTTTPNPVETIEPHKEFCSLDPAPGNCKANSLRFYYDTASEDCLPFVYTGCRGNQNNFVTESECLSSCGRIPTLQQLSDEMVLSCAFGNKSLPLGASVGEGYSGDEPPCGVPVCQCITPPAVTCVQRMCPEPTTTSAPPICATPTCLHTCRQSVGEDGCPTCDCDDNSRNTQSETVIVKAPAKGVKG